MTVVAETAALDISYGGLLFTVLLIMMKKSRKTRVLKPYPIYDQNA